VTRLGGAGIGIGDVPLVLDSRGNEIGDDAATRCAGARGGGVGVGVGAGDGDGDGDGGDVAVPSDRFIGAGTGEVAAVL
jgi:hypothetical protein